ncbi:fimbrial biogenesis outer membrane usher protein [Pseudomonas sp. MG-9]|uniref:fimbria/pilus outer membrane usher protein n=1 Tax=Pseudomonas sp. MG-9 TaxID=2839032 RepID=UPI001C004C35|nr:fimbria/pilus outer membrane usher protein [Pseudomonas sp. MG-9]MBT9266238.1 fimbrial biogenesis outer membrane usher protein [Pseudomonas sp. MG-9]
MHKPSLPGALPGKRSHFALNPLKASVLKGLFISVGACYGPFLVAQEVQFNDAFLPEGSRDLDISAYQAGNPVMPGVYRADVVLNGQLSFRQDVRIEAQPDGRNPVVCMSRELLERQGLEMTKLAAEAVLALDNEGCPALGRLVPGATASFSPENQTLELSIPQVSLKRNARGYVSPELWDRGVTAGLLSYNFNSNRNHTRNGDYDSAYLGLNAGLNLGDWRLRHNGSMSWRSRQGNNYQALNSYAQRDVTALKSQLTVGESITSGELFDTLSYRGVQLASDDRMLPDSLRGYAPVIRGIARTNARVVIRQGGNVLTETTVAPGAFVIDDLYATGYGGDLDVSVLEADGSEQSFTVPYASVSQLLRPGTARFSLTAGQTRDNYINEQARLLQGSLQYGLNNTFTGFAGVQSSEEYLAVLSGLAFATPIGAMAVDMTHAQTTLASGTAKGQSLRLTYSKNILSTGSNFSVAAYRFSTRDYLDFSNAVQLLDAERSGEDVSQFGRPRSRFSVTADQSLGSWGQLAVSGFTQNYWNLPGSDVQYQLSYSRQFDHLAFSVNANRSRRGLGDMQNSFLLTLSMPLEFGASVFSPQMTAQIGRDAQGNFDQQVGITGSAGEDRQFGYGANFSHDGASHTKSASVNGQYAGAQSTLNASLGRGANYTSMSLGASGSLVAHSGGVTLTPYRGETMAIVSAPGAEGAKVAGYPGLKLDGNGNAVVPYLRPYQLNEVGIDPIGSSLDVDLNETSLQVAPRSGAVVHLQYTTTKGRAVLLNVRLDDGSSLPFGASVVDAEGISVGTVGQGGQLYARIKPETRQLLVNWGSKAQQQCALVIPPAPDKEQQLQQLDAVCGAGKQVADGAPADTRKIPL